MQIKSKVACEVGNHVKKPVRHKSKYILSEDAQQWFSTLSAHWNHLGSFEKLSGAETTSQTCKIRISGGRLLNTRRWFHYVPKAENHVRTANPCFSNFNMQRNHPRILLKCIF